MHYNNLVVKVWLKVRLEFIRIQLYLCCIHEKKSGKIFFIREKSGNYQGISFLDFCGHPDERIGLKTDFIITLKGTQPRSMRIKHFNRTFSKTRFFLLSTCVGHNTLSCGTLICILSVGNKFKTYYIG